MAIERAGSPPAWGAGRLVDTWRDEKQQSFAWAYADGVARWIDWPGVGTFFFTLDSPLVRVWPSDSTDVDLSRLETLFRTAVVPVVRQALGAQCLHASAVLGVNGVLALTGVSTSGKSTLALALARAGFPHVADDHVVIIERGGRFFVDAMSAVPRLRPTARRYFDNEPAAHTAFAPPGHYPFAGVIMLEQASTAPAIPVLDRVRHINAFRMLLPHAHCFDPDTPAAAATLVTAYHRVVSQVPIYRLVYPPRLAVLPALVAAIQEIWPAPALACART